ncbi:Protein-glutamate methylesterase/protein-glutamine glutaminase [subsurface metagenome]
MRRILVVDDLEENRYLLQKLLERYNYTVETAINGVEALEKARRSLPDMIITDSLMPKMDGFQLCRELKRDEGLKDVPVLFYSATYTDKKSRKLALDIGAIEYITKPQEPDVFVKIINKAWDKHSKGEVKPIKKLLEEKVYMKTYNERLIQKLEEKMLDLEKSEKHIKYLYSVLEAIRGVNQLIVREKDRDILIQKTCDILIGARGYNTAWLGLLKDEKTFDTVVASPLKELSSFCAQVLKGDYPPCIKKALTKKDLFMIIDRSRDCGDCSLKKLHLGKNSLLMRITHESKLFGFLVLSLEPDVYIDVEEKGLLEEVTDDIALGLHSIEIGENLEKRTYDLKERVKELNCLWEISNLVERPDISLEEIIKGTVNLLPSSWQYPQITCARIILDSKEYKSKNFKKTAWKQASDIILHQKPIGTVEVYYLEERPQMEEGPFLKEERNLINVVAERLGNLIEGKQSEMKLQQSYQKLQKTMEDTISTIGKIAETRDPYTAGHQKNVSQIATFIAQEMKLPKDKIKGVRIASLVHDIGKISLPAEILNKPTKLSKIEFSLIKDHSQVGHDVLKSIDFPWPVARIVLQHHERLNGSGYPNKLKGDKILLESRIIGVADVVEAMSSHRPYRPALGIDAALEEISQNIDILYDPEVVDTCLKLFKEKEFKF